MLSISYFTQVAMNPKNTVFDAKRLIGRKFDDPKIQEDMKHWPFKVVSENGKPKIQVEYKGENKRFTPEEISSMVLTKMKEIAELYLGTLIFSKKMSKKDLFVSRNKNTKFIFCRWQSIGGGCHCSSLLQRFATTSHQRRRCYSWSQCTTYY